MIYVLAITKEGKQIFSHEILLEKEVSFSAQVSSAMDEFRANFATVSLLDDGVKLTLGPKA